MPQVAWKHEDVNTWSYGTQIGSSHVRSWQTAHILPRPASCRRITSPIRFMDTPVFESGELRAIAALQPPLKDGQRAVLANKMNKQWQFGKIWNYQVGTGSPTTDLYIFKAVDDAPDDNAMTVVSPSGDMVIQCLDITELRPGMHIGVLMRRLDGTWPATAETVQMEWRKCTITGMTVDQAGKISAQACWWHDSPSETKCFIIASTDIFFQFAPDAPAISIGASPVLACSSAQRRFVRRRPQKKRH